jgi:outer membrane receptor protein involved in Fe transport
MWQWSALGYAQWRGLESSFAATDAARTTARRTSLQYDVPGRALGGSLEVRPPAAALAELRFGADARFMTGESNEFGSYVAGAPTRDRLSGGQTSHVGLFTEAAWRNGSVLLSAGARVDRWTISNGFNRELVVGSGAAIRDQAYARRSGWLPTGRAGVELSRGDGLSLRGVAYLGWRLPTINELFRPFRLGQDATGANPLLEPERLAGAEVGARLQREGLNLDLTAFLNRLAGPIANVTIGRGPGTFPDIGFVGAGGLARQRQNLQAITVHGVEASASVSRGPWTAALSASAVRARVAAGLAADLQGLRPAQTPARSASLQLGWAAGGSVASLQLRYMGAQFEDDLNRIELPSAVTADLFGAVPLSGRWQLVGRVENLFDEEVVAAITSDGVVERATPRTLWLGLRFRQP